MRPYFAAENQCFAPKLVTMQYTAVYLAEAANGRANSRIAATIL